MLTQENLKKGWNKLLPLEEQQECEAHDALNGDDDLQEIVDLFPRIPEFSECDKKDAETLLTNANDPGYQIMNEDEIISYVQENREWWNPSDYEEKAEDCLLYTSRCV